MSDRNYITLCTTFLRQVLQIETNLFVFQPKSIDRNSSSLCDSLNVASIDDNDYDSTVCAHLILLSFGIFGFRIPLIRSW